MPRGVSLDGNFCSRSETVPVGMHSDKIPVVRSFIPVLGNFASVWLSFVALLGGRTLVLGSCVPVFCLPRTIVCLCVQFCCSFRSRTLVLGSSIPVFCLPRTVGVCLSVLGYLLVFGMYS